MAKCDADLVRNCVQTGTEQLCDATSNTPILLVTIASADGDIIPVGSTDFPAGAGNGVFSTMGFARSYYADLQGNYIDPQPTNVTKDCTEPTTLDPEVVCLVPNGSPDGTVSEPGIAVYDTSVVPPTTIYYIGQTDVTATHTQVTCSSSDIEQTNLCYANALNPTEKFTRIDWFDRSDLTTPIATVWFNQTTGAYSTTEPANLIPCASIDHESTAVLGCADNVPYKLERHTYTDTASGQQISVVEGWFDSAGTELTAAPANFRLGPCAQPCSTCRDLGTAPVLQPNVIVTKTTPAGPYNPGEIVTSTITIDNTGDGAASSVSVVDNVPASVASRTFVSSETGGGTGNTPNGTTDINDTVALPAAAIITYTVNDTMGPSGQSYQNTVTVMGFGVAGTPNTVNGNDPGTIQDDPVEPPFELIQYTYTEQPPSQAVRDDLEAARTYWNTVLTDPLAPVSYNGDPAYTQIDLEVTFPAIDGNFGTLAQAGPYLPSARGMQPVNGILQVDIADAETFAGNGLLEIIKHELFHALGGGTITGDAASGPLCSGGQYTGAKALAEYSVLTGNAETSIPTDTCGHWSEATFNTELNSPEYDAGTPNPNSRMSLALLEDLGYNPDYSLADPYVIGQPVTGSSISWTCSGHEGLCVIKKV